MKYCFYCGQTMPDDARFCSKCGKEQENLSNTRNEENQNNDATTKQPPNECKSEVKISDNIQTHHFFSEMNIIKPLLTFSILCSITISAYYGYKANIAGNWLIDHQRNFYRGAYNADTDFFRHVMLDLNELSTYVIISSIISVLLFIYWVYQANKNISCFQNIKSKYSCGGILAGFFIPIFNLFRPYQILKEIWTHSLSDKEGTIAIKFWWFTVLFVNFASIFLINTFKHANSIQGYGNGLVMISVAMVLAVVESLFTIWLVNQVTSMQKQKYLSYKKPSNHFFADKSQQNITQDTQKNSRVPLTNPFANPFKVPFVQSRINCPKGHCEGCGIKLSTTHFKYDEKGAEHTFCPTCYYT